MPKVAGVDVFERPSFAPSEMLVPRQCVPIVFLTPGESGGHDATRVSLEASSMFDLRNKKAARKPPESMIAGDKLVTRDKGDLSYHTAT
jgi:hypothetical protein